MTTPVTFADVTAAQARLQGLAHRTPVLTSSALDRLTGARLHFKCENFQRVGAFKFRGAANAIFSLPEGACDVATHSSGNHAQAVALAARMRGMAAHLVMPRNVVAVKLAAVKAYGGRVTFCEPGIPAREAALRRVLEETGAEFIPPYNDTRVIAGQGTAALELLDEVPDLEMILAPVGGGGLLSGTAIVARARGMEPRGAEPLAADDAFRSLRDGTLYPSIHPQTIADGLMGSLGPLTFATLREHRVPIERASEAAIRRAMRLLWERMKLVIEPSGALPLAALLESPLPGRKIGIILSGGNVELESAARLFSCTSDH